MNFQKRKNIFLPAISLIVISLFVIAGCRNKTESALPTADDEKTIRQLTNEFIAVICSFDTIPLTRLEEIFADDFCQMTMEEKIIQGKQDNMFFYRSRREKNQSELRSQSGRYDIKSVKMSPDLAVVFGKVEAEKWFKNAPEPMRGSFLETLVFQKIDGKWYLVEEQSIVPKPASSEKPAATPPIQQEKTEEPNIRKALRSMPGDEEQVRKVAREFLKPFQLDDNDPFAGAEKGFHENIVVVTSNGQFMQGKENVLRAYRQSWEEARREFDALNISCDIQSVNMMGDAATVFGKIRTDGRLKDANGVFHREVWETLILQKIDDRWQIVQEHSTAAAPMDIKRAPQDVPDSEKQTGMNKKSEEPNINKK